MDYISFVKSQYGVVFSHQENARVCPPRRPRGPERHYSPPQTRYVFTSFVEGWQRQRKARVHEVSFTSIWLTGFSFVLFLLYFRIFLSSLLFLVLWVEVYGDHHGQIKDCFIRSLKRGKTFVLFINKLFSHLMVFFGFLNYYL